MVSSIFLVQFLAINLPSKFIKVLTHSSGATGRTIKSSLNGFELLDLTLLYFDDFTLFSFRILIY